MLNFVRRIAIAVFTAAVLLPAGMLLVAQATHPAASDYAGTWHWIFEGKPFATMVLEQKDGVLTGTVTNESMHMDEQGRITDVRSRPGSSPIVRTSIVNGVLVIVEKDGDDELEWAMKLTSATTAELKIQGVGAPENAEAIQVVKAQ